MPVKKSVESSHKQGDTEEDDHIPPTPYDREKKINRVKCPCVKMYLLVGPLLRPHPQMDGLKTVPPAHVRTRPANLYCLGLPGTAFIGHTVCGAETEHVIPT